MLCAVFLTLLDFLRRYLDNAARRVSNVLTLLPNMWLNVRQYTISLVYDRTSFRFRVNNLATC